MTPNFLNTNNRGWQSRIGKFSILIALLINSLTLTVLFIILSIEWESAEKEDKYQGICNGEPKIYDYAIDLTTLYFVFISMVLSCLIVLLQVKKFGLEKHAYSLLSLVSTVTFILSTLLTVGYIIGENYISDGCDGSSRINTLKLRFLMQIIGAAITNALYMGIGMVVSPAKKSRVPAGRVYSITPPEFDTALPPTPPPPYYQYTSSKT
uniref:MARVEL domain-containing protein n=1 Tax=Acrobeloides nanus TaxID=290746 RepID=A0A914CTP9_9BILA